MRDSPRVGPFSAAASHGWEPPSRIAQLDLFVEPRDRMLARISVSIDEIERWRALGWISFDVREVAGLDHGRVCEICFIRNLARSGLSDVQIDQYLGELEPPYLYDPMRTAYSFAFGWVQLPRMPSATEIDEFFEAHFDSWVQHKALLGERDFLFRLQLSIAFAMVESRGPHDPSAEQESS